MTPSARLTRVLRTFLHEQARSVRFHVTGQSIRDGVRVDLSAWDDAMADAVRPLLLEEARLHAMIEVNDLHHRHLDVDFSMRHLHRRVAAKVEEDVRRLAKETNEVWTRNLNERIRELRWAVRRGELNGMEAKRSFANFVYQEVATAGRAERIADNELLRAQEAGKLVAAVEAGHATGKVWEAEATACDRCASLNGKVVPIDEPFWIDPKGGPYAFWMQSPGHVNCKCRNRLHYGLLPKPAKKRARKAYNQVDEMIERELAEAER